MKKIRYCFCLLILVFIPACGLLLEEGREVVAEASGESIRLKDLLRQIRRLPFDARAKTNDDDKTVRLAARRSVLRMLVVQKLLAKEAEARGVTITDEELDAAFKREEEQAAALDGLMEGFGGITGSHETMHGNEAPTRREIKEMREKLAIEKMLEAQLSDEVVRSYYDEHVQEFTVSSPLVSYEMALVDAANGEVIDRLYQKAAQEGMGLSEALASLNDVPPNVSVGTTPLTSLYAIAPIVREKLENLKVGEISEPFHVFPAGKDHYVVARLVNYTDKVPFENIQEQVRARLYRNFIDELHKRYEVVYHEEILDYSVGN